MVRRDHWRMLKRCDVLLELTLCAVTPSGFDFSSFDVVFLEDDDQGCGDKMGGHSIVR
jgi:hypothetical protein